MKLKIILNADDFGKSPERNRAIDDAFKQGLIKSAGLIVTGCNLQNAIDLANDGGYMNKLHLHFNLSANLMHEKSEDTPLTDNMKKDSFFCTDGKFTKYHGLPHRFIDIRKWRVVYTELIAQYHRFKELTHGEADYKHVDFHLWYNLTWPVSLALNLFTWKYKIETVRYCGIHQKDNRRYKYYRILSWNPQVRCIPATNIDYFLTMKHLFSDCRVLELYCHPNYKEGVFLDDSPSYLKHDRQPFQKQIKNLKDLEGIQFISWEDVK